MKTFAAVSMLAMASFAFGQSQQEPVEGQSTPDHSSKRTKSRKDKKQRGAAGEIGSGVGSTAGGVAKGAGSAASGVGKGAVDLATLHPIDAGASVGTGAVKAGKDVTVGSVKGAGKVGKGVGKAIKKIL